MTAPGVYDGIPEDQYHADKGSLSVSGAKKLLPPSCPALFKHDLDHGRAEKNVWDFGRVAHAKVLSVGSEVVVVQKVNRQRELVDADGYDTESAKKHVEEIRAQGKTPLLRREVEQVDGMAQAILKHPLASRLLDPKNGKPEQSAYRLDPTTGVLLRHRYDWLPEANSDGHLVIPDYKTTPGDLSDHTLSGVIAKWRYDMQIAAYSDTAVALGLCKTASMPLIFQMKSAPYLIRVVELDDVGIERGRRDFRAAVDIYAECLRTGVWPGYGDDIDLLPLPAWATWDLDTEMVA